MRGTELELSFYCSFKKKLESKYLFIQKILNFPQNWAIFGLSFQGGGGIPKSFRICTTGERVCLELYSAWAVLDLCKKRQSFIWKMFCKLCKDSRILKSLRILNLFHTSNKRQHRWSWNRANSRAGQKTLFVKNQSAHDVFPWCVSI